MEQISQKTRKITVMGLLLALISILSFIEHLLPPLPGMPPNVRYGLSNVITMYTLFFLGTKYAYTMTVLKAIMVTMQRGATAGFTSIVGGMLSLTCMILLDRVFRQKLSYLVLSIVGAIGHNTGQMIAASLIFKQNILVKYFVPITIPMTIMGGILGAVTGTLLGVIMPVFHKMTGIQAIRQERKIVSGLKENENSH